MPSRAISRPIAWKTHAKISIPTRSACNQIKQDQRLDLAIPITLHGSLDTCVSAPLLSPSRRSRSLALSFHPASSSKRTTNREREREWERERERKREGKPEERRERRAHERSHPLWPCTLPTSVSLYLRAKRGAVSILGPLWERLRVRVCLHANNPVPARRQRLRVAKVVVSIELPPGRETPSRGDRPGQGNEVGPMRSNASMVSR